MRPSTGVDIAAAASGKPQRTRDRDPNVAEFARTLMLGEERMLELVREAIRLEGPGQMPPCIMDHLAASLQALLEALVRGVEARGWRDCGTASCNISDPLISFVTVEAMARAADGLDAEHFRRLMQHYREAVARVIFECDADWESARLFYAAVSDQFARLQGCIVDKWFPSSVSTRGEQTPADSRRQATAPAAGAMPVMVVGAGGGLEHANAAAVHTFGLASLYGVPLRCAPNGDRIPFLAREIGAFLRAATPRFHLVWSLETIAGRHEYRAHFKRRYSSDGSCAGVTIAFVDLESMGAAA